MLINLFNFTTYSFQHFYRETEGDGLSYSFFLSNQERC